MFQGIGRNGRRAADLLEGVLGEPHTAGDTASHFTCGEAEDVAEALRLLGKPDAAQVWLDAHSEGDDPDDSHYRGETA